MLSESQWYTQMPDRGSAMEYFEDALSPYLFPEFHQQHPWNKGSACDKDFILISEFCEQEGPKPLITIPTYEGSKFDKNEFVVRIMAVDHQTASGGFSLPEDTQVVMTELKNGTYAYVHHFTLFDHHARGFVRPFCMSYVTADPRKIMSFFEDLSSEFNKVSRYFKYGNRIVFAKDLENHLKDLQFTRDRVVQIQCERSGKGEVTLAENERFLKDCSVELVDQAIQEVTDILKQVKPQLTDERLEERFRRLEQKAISNKNKKMSNLFESISLREERNDKGSPRRKQHAGSFSGTSEADFVFLNREAKHKVKLIQLGRRRFEEALRGLHELCQWGAKDGLNRLRSIHKYFSRDCAILEIEKEESPLIDPHCSLLTIGRCVATNFLHDIDLQCAGANWSLGTCSKDQRLFHPTNNLFRRWLSNETLDSYKSLDSFLSAQDDEPMISAKSSYEPAFVMASARMELSGPDDPDQLGSHFGDNCSVDSDWVDIPISHPALTDLNQSEMSDNRNSTPACSDITNEISDQQIESREATEQINVSMTDSALGSSTIDNKVFITDSDIRDSNTPVNVVFSSNIKEPVFNHTHSFEGMPVIKFNQDAKDCEIQIDNENMNNGKCLTIEQSKLINGIDRSDYSEESTHGLEGLKKSTDSGIDGEIKDDISPEETDSVCTFILQQTENGFEPSTPSSTHEGKSLLSLAVKSSTGSFIERINRPDTASYDSVSDIDDTATPPSEVSSLRKIKVAVFSAADHVCRMSPASPGYKILRLCHMYSHLDGVIYSLLCGRPVVIIGSHKVEREIREVVTALELFLPGYSSTFESVNPLHHKPLRLPDILKYRLMGLCRQEKRSLDYMIPNSVKRYVTMFDIEKRYITSPSYQGVYVNLMLSHVHHFKNEESFIAYLHSVLLEIASQAYLYYHLFSLNSSVPRKRPSPLSTQCYSHRKGSISTLQKLSIQDSDIHIIQHLVDLISCQQLDQFFTKINTAPEFTALSLKYIKGVCRTVRC